MTSCYWYFSNTSGKLILCCTATSTYWALLLPCLIVDFVLANIKRPGIYRKTYKSLLQVLNSCCTVWMYIYPSLTNSWLAYFVSRINRLGSHSRSSAMLSCFDTVLRNNLVTSSRSTYSWLFKYNRFGSQMANKLYAWICGERRKSHLARKMIFLLPFKNVNYKKGRNTQNA